ncbi:DUF3426 domain-containing protein [Duganella sp. Root198D2]|uniref:DUF3426 domain-containing protein n=1 Tax=Duganella sp. Root198D2 TaxID=1736489 RepID=UPI00070D3E0B|nr:DUF3426 domain-containing protein [Duganella sp. Root198D2]KRB83685.1 hypothetical protein ASE26_10990 [Duganella sp. Root198D2]
MALATKCPHCSTIFRVAADQLKLRGGIVRCGSCALVFDGNAALVEPAAKPTPVIPDVVADAPPAKPAISDYVHGSPVDFEIDFAETPVAAPLAGEPPKEAPRAAVPAAEAASPAVWRSATAPASGATSSVAGSLPVAEPAPAAAQPPAKAPSPDDIAIAAVTRAFAAATTHAAPQSQQAAPSRAAEAPRAPASVPAALPPATRTPSSPASRSLIDVVSPDATFTAAAEPSPPLVPDTAAVSLPSRARSPAGLSSLADLVAPDDIFSATAEASTPLAPPPPDRAPSPAAPAWHPDVLSPDITFSATTKTTPAAAAPAAPTARPVFAPAPPPLPVAASIEEAVSPVVPVPPAVTGTPAAAPLSDSVGHAPQAVNEAAVATPAALADSPVVEAQPHRDETLAESLPAAEENTLPSEPALAIAATSPVDHADLPAEAEAPSYRDETPVESLLPEDHVESPADADASPLEEEIPLEPVYVAEEAQPTAEGALAFEAPSPPDHADSPAAIEAQLPGEAFLAEPAQTAGETALLADAALAFETPSHVEHQDETPAEPGHAAEENLGPLDDALALETTAPAEPELAIDDIAVGETGERTGTSLLDAIDQWSADNTHPDGRVEPSLHTPQEHLVIAALDDAHHFEDLPSDERSAPDAPAAAAEADSLDGPPLDAEPWAAADAAAAGEPWSLAEPDETALHAVAAVNTDAPDDGASVTDDEVLEPVEPPARSRRERALKRAKSRRDASPPGAEHDVFAIEENGPEAEASAEEIAARMRAIAGVDEAEAKADANAGDLDHSDLNFVKRVDRSQKYGKAVTITMALGVPILLAGLVLQAATTFRDTLAANYPQLKPALAAVCQPLGCKIALPTQLDALSVEPGELASMTENTFSFSTVLRNQSKTPQAWPHVELTLNDNADKPVLRRVFAPGEYLPSPADAEKGFGPRSEQSIKLYFELKELKASGYHIAIFYP